MKLFCVLVVAFLSGYIFGQAMEFFRVKRKLKEFLAGSEN